MRAIEIDMPLSDTYQPGDVADVYLDGAEIARGVPLAPGCSVHAGHYGAGHFRAGHYASRVRVGHWQGCHYRDGHYRPRRHVQCETEDLYHGLHAVTVRTFDAIGNEQDDPPESAGFINTGPRAASRLRFASQAPDGGPITFGFQESPELVR